MTNGIMILKEKSNFGNTPRFGIPLFYWGNGFCHRFVTFEVDVILAESGSMWRYVLSLVYNDVYTR